MNITTATLQSAYVPFQVNVMRGAGLGRLPAIPGRDSMLIPLPNFLPKGSRTFLRAIELPIYGFGFPKSGFRSEQVGLRKYAREVYSGNTGETSASRAALNHFASAVICLKGGYGIEEIKAATAHLMNAANSFGDEEKPIDAVILAELVTTLLSQIELVDEGNSGDIASEREIWHRTAGRLWLDVQRREVKEIRNVEIASQRGIWHATMVGDYDTVCALFDSVGDRNVVSNLMKSVRTCLRMIWTMLQTKMRDSEFWRNLLIGAQLASRRYEHLGELRRFATKRDLDVLCQGANYFWQHKPMTDGAWERLLEFLK